MKFSKENRAFDRALKERVSSYFEEHNLNRYGDMRAYVKTLIFAILWLGPFILHFFYGFPLLVSIGLGIISGLAMAGINMGTMHDAMHGSYSKKKWVNNLLGYGILELLSGGDGQNWKEQHNIGHHTFTNVVGHDDDIGTPLFRFAKACGHKNAHKYQHIYAKFSYPLMTLLWITTKDWSQIKRYLENGRVKKRDKAKRYVRLAISKTLYYTVWIVLPLIFWESAWSVLGFFLAMHLVCGNTLANIFQMAHVLPETDIYEEGDQISSFAEHQLRTTANFATDNKLMTWYCGGLNHQVEHHLFSNYCHVHYPAISKIVRSSAKKFGLPYHENATFRSAKEKHFFYLEELGQVA
jgi:linoleoyl-CoA desaturase